jgi:uncharacterized protein DUF5677
MAIATDEVRKQPDGPLTKADKREVSFEFDSDGFLTDRRGTLEAAINGTHDRLLKRARQINRDSHDLIFTVAIHKSDPKEILCATLFVRALEHYQATLILLGTGLIASAKVTLRAIMECVFTTRAVALDKDAWRIFINNDLLQRKKLIRSAQQHDYPNFGALRDAITSDFVENLERQIRDSGAKHLTIKELSEWAGMHDWYTTHYALLSTATHTNVRELEAYLSLDESEEFQYLKYAPSTDKIPHLALTAAHCILIAANAVTEVFEIDFQDKIDEHLAFIETEIGNLR